MRKDDKFASAKRKLARAKEHTDHIETRYRKFFKKKPYARLVETDPKTGYQLHKIKLTKPLPNKITDLAYDAIDALRSALDQVTYAVAIICGASRPDLVHFPVSDTALEVDNLLGPKGRLKDFPPDIIALFRGFNAHKGGNLLIWALNRVRREGYHRFIVPVGTASAGMIVNQMQLMGAIDIPAPHWDTEKDEIIFAKVGPHANLEYDIQLSFYIAFGEVEGVANFSVIDTLRDMIDEVGRIVSAIEAETNRLFCN